MAPSAQDKWDEKYRGAMILGDPSSVLPNNLQLLPRTGRAVDLACGISGNALVLLKQGFDVEAWDISAQALQVQQRHGISTLRRDIETLPPEPNSFDVIVVAQFLDRGICEAIGDALRPRGCLFYQTFLAQKKTSSGPSSKRFLLQREELPRLFPQLKVLHYREDDDRAYFVGTTST